MVKSETEATVQLRYGDAELREFKTIILDKLDKARRDYSLLMSSVTHSGSNDTEDTSPTFKILEEGASALSKEEAGHLAVRQQKFIHSLEAALMRIENKSYGVCRETGKLIPKARLLSVPHATLSIEAKSKSPYRNTTIQPSEQQIS
jgi:RNA polymerase-binding transcription factor DksA